MKFRTNSNLNITGDLNLNETGFNSRPGKTKRGFKQKMVSAGKPISQDHRPSPEPLIWPFVRMVNSLLIAPCANCQQWTE